VFFLALSYSNANVCTISENSINACQKTSQELVTISNETDQRKFNPISSYYIRDTYRTRNLNIRSEVRRIRVDGKEQERRFRFRVDDTRRVSLTRSKSLPNIDIQHGRIRNTRERNNIWNAQKRDVVIRGTDQRISEQNNRRFMEIRSDRKALEREVRDSRYERQTSREKVDARRRTTNTRQNMVTINDKDASTSWPFSNFVQSTIGVLGLYYFGMHNKSAK